MDTQSIIIPSAVLIRPPEERDSRDYVRGLSSQIVPVVNRADRNWTNWLPTDEPQKYLFDTDECTQLSGINDLETQCNWLKDQGKFSTEALAWFTNNGYFDSNGSFAFSERFIGILSGTSIKGNTPWAFWQAIAKYGLLPRADLSYSLVQSQHFSTQEAMCKDYYNPAVVTSQMRQKALGTLQWLNVQYEWLGAGEWNNTTPSSAILEALEQAPVQIAVPVCLPGWNENVIPLCPADRTDHAIIIHDVNEDGSWAIRDHYNPYNKTLPKGYYIPQAVLGVVLPAPVAPPSIAADQNQVPTQTEISWFSAMLVWIGQKLASIRQPQGVGKVINDIICDSSHNMDTPAAGNTLTHKSFGILSSSENPQKLAATVTGLIISLSSLIIFFAGRIGFPLTVEQITTYAGALGTSIGAIWTLFGIIRKVVIAVQQKLAV